MHAANQIKKAIAPKTKQTLFGVIQGGLPDTGEAELQGYWGFRNELTLQNLQR